MKENLEEIYSDLINKYNFDKNQKALINYGLKEGLDVTWYAKPEFNNLQMEQIRFGLENKVNVIEYRSII